LSNYEQNWALYVPKWNANAIEKQKAYRMNTDERGSEWQGRGPEWFSLFREIASAAKSGYCLTTPFQVVTKISTYV
jgi:hypothetical protein